MINKGRYTQNMCQRLLFSMKMDKNIIRVDIKLKKGSLEFDLIMMPTQSKDFFQYFFRPA